MTSEAVIQREIQLACSRDSARLFRQNVAQAWVGTVVRQTPHEITLRKYRPLHAGLTVGSCDLLGWTSTIIRPEHVGLRLAAFTGIEVKSSRGKLSLEQERFIKAVRAAGGIAGVARSVEDARALLNTFGG